MKKTKEQISNNMKKFKNRDYKIEFMLRSEFWKRDVRYRKNVKSIFGKPDIAFCKYKVAVFCDSEFWHGYKWEEKKKDFKLIRSFGFPKYSEIWKETKKSMNI